MVSQLPLKQFIEGSKPSACAQRSTHSGVAAVGSQRLALNQKFAGSIPASGVVAVLYWFQGLGCEPSLCRFNSDRSPLVAGRLRSAVRLCYGTAECAYYFLEGIRHGRKAPPPTKWEDKGKGRGSVPSLETAGSDTASGFESLVFRFKLFESNSPVA